MCCCFFWFGMFLLVIALFFNRLLFQVIVCVFGRNVCVLFVYAHKFMFDMFVVCLCDLTGRGRELQGARASPAAATRRGGTAPEKHGPGRGREPPRGRPGAPCLRPSARARACCMCICVVCVHVCVCVMSAPNFPQHPPVICASPNGEHLAAHTPNGRPRELPQQRSQ